MAGRKVGGGAVASSLWVVDSGYVLTANRYLLKAAC